MRVSPLFCRMRESRNRFGHLAALALTLLVGPATTAAYAQTSGQVENPVSQFPITVDGQFTGGVGGVVQGEWSDVTPLAFISPPTNAGTLLRTNVGDPRANSLLYATIAPGVAQESLELYLMYDYLPRTNPTFSPGEFIADIRFPVTLPNQSSKQMITVQFRANSNNPSLVNVLVDQNGDGSADTTAEAIGMEGAVGFGPSTLSSLNHLLVELEVSLRIPAGFGTPGGPFPPGGINPSSGLYDPDPAFWGANITNDVVDPPASAAIFQILPNGTTVANSTIVPAAADAPEPGTIALLFGAFAPLMAGEYWRSRRRRN